MEIGLSSASFYPEINTEDSIRLMSSIGFDTGEVFLNTPSEYEENFIKLLIEEKEKYNFKSRPIHACSSQSEPFLFDKYKRRREDMFVYYKKLCKAARMLGAESYTFHGMRLGNFNTMDKELILDVYNEMNYISQEQGIKLSQENVSWCMSSNLDFLLYLREEMKDSLYFTLDIKQAYKAFTEPEKYLDIMKENINNLHINDRDEKHLCMLPGKGKVDYKNIFSKLNNIGYKGISIIEVYRENYSGYNELMEAKEYLSKII